MKQISVFVENRPGSLMEVTSKLVEAEINIRAVSSFDTPEFGILRMVVDNPQKAKETLTHLGFVVRITDVVGVELKDEKGNLNRMLSILADGQINLNYIYSFVIRDGSAPVMVFEYILKQNGIDPQKDLAIDQSIDFGSTAAAFSGGQGDFTVEFEPGATTLESSGKGYVVASLGKESGYVPYTAFSAKKSYIEKHPDVIQSFTNALQKGMDYVNSHTPEEISKVIQPQFKENDLDTITTIVSRYYEQKTWKEDLIFNQDSFELLQDILEDADELDSRTPYGDLVTTEFAKKAVK